MKLIEVITRKVDKSIFSTALIIAGILLAWYLATFFLASVDLYTYMSAPAREIQDNPVTLAWYEQDLIMLDDSMLGNVPKLKQALIKASEMPVLPNGDRDHYRATLSSPDIDQINKMLAGSPRGKQLISEGWDNDYRRGDLLYPYPSSFVEAGYNGNAYQLVVLTPQ